MSIIKNKLKTNFSQIPNNLILDNRLSCGSKVVMMYLFSLPDGWIINNTDVMKKLRIGTRGTLSKYWKELLNANWISRCRLKNNKGHFDNFEYTLHSTSGDN